MIFDKTVFDRCPKCGEWTFLNGHKCLPTWSVIDLDNYSEADELGLWETVRAFNERDAAEEFTKEYDREYCGPDLSDALIVIVRDGNGTESWFTVSGEWVPHYTVGRHDPKETPDA